MSRVASLTLADMRARHSFQGGFAYIQGLDPTVRLVFKVLLPKTKFEQFVANA
jgi:hypothetical protein